MWLLTTTRGTKIVRLTERVSEEKPYNRSDVEGGGGSCQCKGVKIEITDFYTTLEKIVIEGIVRDGVTILWT